METYLKRFRFFTLLFFLGSLSLYGNPRVIKGTISRDGKPLSGALVTVHKSKTSYFTSFDGKYEVKADSKSKWIKYSFSGQAFKKELDPNGSDYLDFQFPSRKEGTVTSPPDKGGTIKKETKNR